MSRPENERWEKDLSDAVMDELFRSDPVTLDEPADDEVLDHFLDEQSFTDWSAAT